MAKDKNKKVPFNVFKKGFVGALLGATILSGGVGLAGCGQAGPQGPQGEQGPAGTNGSTWYSGSQYDPAQGVTGDFFFDIDDGSIYVKLASGWTPISNIKGPEGDPGKDGAAGKDGEDGKDGSSWLTGTSAPTAAVGKNGDTYLDIVTNYIYTKTSGAWTKIGELSGDRDITINDQRPWLGKTAVFVGDSITYGSGCSGKKYWELLEESLGFSQVTAMGVPGSCFSTTSNYGNGNSPLINRYQSIPQADLIQIFMGTNDYGHNTPIGKIEDTTDVSFYGALNVILPALQQKYTSARIVVVTPLHRYGATGLTYDYLENGAGHTLKDYVDAMKEVCERYSIPVIDLFNNSGLNPSLSNVQNIYMPDGLHPNATGHQLIANIMNYWLKLYATATPDNDVAVTPPTPGEGEDDDDTQLPEGAIALQLGNKYFSGNADDNTRASTTKNIYLKAGTTISLKDSNYLYGVFQQTGEAVAYGATLQAWTAADYVVQADGWYGIAVAHDDKATVFNFSTDSQNVYDYVIITPPTEEGETPTDPTPGEGEDDDGQTTEVEFLIGNKFAAQQFQNAQNRATAEKNVYLTAGTVVSLVDSVNYLYGLYSTTSETSKAGNLKSSNWVNTPITIETEGWYGLTLAKKSDANFDFTVDAGKVEDYFVFTEQTTPGPDAGGETPTDPTPGEGEDDDDTQLPEGAIALQLGNKYFSGNANDNTRASATKNIYLKAGTTISLKDSNYEYGVFQQTSESVVVGGTTLQAWTAADYVVQADGWYGIAVAHSDKTTAFDFSVDSQNVYDYVIITPLELTEVSLQGFTLETGNKFDANFASNTTRASMNKNVYLKAGSVISLADENYQFGVFKQTSETVAAGECLQVWTTVDYVIQADGWYGIAFAHSELTTEFEFDQDSTDASTYVSIVGPQA